MLYLPAVMHQRRILPLLLAASCAAALVVVPRPLGGHETPARVAVQAYVQPHDTPDGPRLRLLLRVPLEAMRDVEFPLRADGALDLVEVRTLLPDAARLWLANYLTLEEDGRALDAPRIVATRIAIPTDRSFESFATALAHMDAPPLGTEVELHWQPALLDVLLEYRIDRTDARFTLVPALAHLGVRTTSVLRIVRPDGSERILTYAGNPGRVVLEPRWYDAALAFLGDGFRHILGGFDHLLFLFCLVLPVRRWRAQVAIVTAFTVAHSITLGAAALGFVPTALWFPPLVEAGIALSILWLAVENVLLAPERLETRWSLAFGFGLIHGFGFAFALGDQLQFASGHLVAALASFNLGVELGQLLVLALVLPLLALLLRRVGADRERAVVIVGSVIVAHTAWHWAGERLGTLGEFRGALAWPALDASFALGAMRVALLASVALAAGLAMRHILRTVWRP